MRNSNLKKSLFECNKNINGKNPIINQSDADHVETPRIPTPQPVEERSWDGAEQTPPIIEGLPEPIAPIWTPELRKELGLEEEEQTAQQERNLQHYNITSVPFKLTAFSTGTAQTIQVTYNNTTTDDLVDYISFGDYYNIIGVWADISNLAGAGTAYVVNPAILEFYLMKEGIADATSPTGTTMLPIPKSAQTTTEDTNVTWTTSGVEYDYETLHLSLDPSVGMQFLPMPNDRYGFRTFGVALKYIFVNLATSTDTATSRMRGVFYLQRNSASKTL